MFFKTKKVNFTKNILKINKTTKIYKYNINCENTKKLKKIKILHLSDTHFSKFKPNIKKNNELFSKLKNKKFDIIIHTGDIIEYSLNEFLKKDRNHLKNLKAKYGKYYVNGNHEYYNKKEKELETIMQTLNFENLSNKTKIIKLENNNNNNINLIGIDPFSNKNNNRLKINKNDFNLLITHNLDLIKKEKINLFNLILSGHLHSGEINLGIINGITILKLKKIFENKFKQTKKFKKLTKKTLSFIHPGMYTHSTKIYNLPRILTQKEGAVILKFK